MGYRLLALGAGWVALWSWRGLVAEPGALIRGALLSALLLAITGAVGRTLGLRWPGVAAAQLVIGVAHLVHHTGGFTGPLAVLPRAADLRRFVGEVRDGAAVVSTQYAPVEDSAAVTYLLLLGLATMWLIDVLAVGARRPAWAGLPLLGALMVPVGILQDRLPWWVLGAVALLYWPLLTRRPRRPTTPRTAPTESRPGPPPPKGSSRRRSPFASSELPWGMLLIVGPALAAALVTMTLLPDGRALIDLPERGPSSAVRADLRLTAPEIDMRRRLIERSATPMLTASVDTGPAEYLRIAVLDRFTHRAWVPGPRELHPIRPGSGAAARMPAPQGLSPTVHAIEQTWDVELAEGFVTAWLPTPYPLAQVNRLPEASAWRYDPSTLDIAHVTEGEPPSPGLHYRVTSRIPDITAALLRSAGPAPARLSDTVTAVPSRLDPALRRLAEQVTFESTSDYERAVALQNWFRSTGDFTYSLEPGDATGAAALSRFLLRDRTGYCEHFATGMATLARLLGIPARVAVGFLSPTGSDPEGRARAVFTSDDLHAWPELFLSGAGWVRFEPTPSVRTGGVPPWTPAPRHEQAAPEPEPPARADDPTPTAEPTDPTPPDAGQESPAAGADAAPGVSPNAGSVVRMVGLFLLIAALATVPALVRERRRRRRTRPVPPGTSLGIADSAEALWDELLDSAVDLGIAVPTGRSVAATAAALPGRPGPEGSAASEGIDTGALVTYVEEARYGPSGDVDAARHAAMASLTTLWIDHMARSRRPGDRRRALWLPRSLWRRGRAATAGPARATSQ